MQIYSEKISLALKIVNFTKFTRTHTYTPWESIIQKKLAHVFHECFHKKKQLVTPNENSHTLCYFTEHYCMQNINYFAQMTLYEDINNNTWYHITHIPELQQRSCNHLDTSHQPRIHHHNTKKGSLRNFWKITLCNIPVLNQIKSKYPQTMLVQQHKFKQ